MDKPEALVTGATSGIGRAVAEQLLGLGYRVFGVGRNFEGVFPDNPDFVPLKCDLADFQAVKRLVEKVKKEAPSLDLLVHTAGLGRFGLHEEISAEEIRDMVAVNLQAPLLLTSGLLRRLKDNRGQVVLISSITAKEAAPLGAAYSATKAGISHFAESLFEEVRKTGVRVSVIHPDIVKTSFYNTLRFCPDDDPESFLEPAVVADAVSYLATRPAGTVVREMTIQPQKRKIRHRGRKAPQS